MKPSNAIKMLRRRLDYLEPRARAARLVGRPMSILEAELDALEVGVQAIEALMKRYPSLDTIGTPDFTDRVTETL